MEMRLTPDGIKLTVESKLRPVRQLNEEICYICTEDLCPGDLVYAMVDDEGLRWFAHGSCLRAGTRACG